MPDKKTIHEAVVAVMRDVHAVGKNETNAAQKFKFRGVDAVVNALAPAMRKHGLFVVPALNTADYSTRTSANGGELQVCRLSVAFTLCSDGDGGTLTGVVASEAFDSGDKATAKAMSVALRTFLLQTFMLPTDDKDPDQDTYETKRTVDRSGADSLKQRADAVAVLIPDTKTLEELNNLFDAAVTEGVSETLKPAFTAQKGKLSK
jgi:hypothetical protein